MEHSIKEPLNQQKEKFLEGLSSDALKRFRSKIFPCPLWSRVPSWQDTDISSESLMNYEDDLRACVFDQYLHKLYIKALLRESIDDYVKIYEGELSI